MKQRKNKYQLDHTIKPLVFQWIKSHKNRSAKEYFKENPADIHLKGWMSDTPLHIACLSGNIEMVQYLIENGANVNAQRTGVYATPLCWAENVEIAEYLLHHGATMNDLELYKATREDRNQVIDILLKNGAKINENAPQYLECKSLEAVKIYLKYQVNIKGCDETDCNLLHQLTILDLPEAFELALKTGVPWQKDSSKRTPFFLAKKGKRNKIIKLLSEKYPELISNEIRNLDVDFEFDKIAFILKSPEGISNYIALTESNRLINYEANDDGALIITKAVEVDVAMIRNFTINASGHIIFPTGENKLLKIDSANFELIETIFLDEGTVFDQITYLPKRKIYIGSSNDWKITILNEKFEIVTETDAEDGTFSPLINEKESLILFESYDQTTFFDLYRLESDGTINFIHSFFEDKENMSKSAAFIGDEILVAFPKKIECYQIHENNLIKIQEINTEAHKSLHDICSLAAIAKDIILLGKGDEIMVYRRSDQIQQIEKIQLKLKKDIRQIYYDKNSMSLLVMTDAEIQLIHLKDKDWVR